MRYFIKPALLLLAGIAVTATGCLKDDAFEDGAIQSIHSDNPVKVIELKLTANDASNFLVLAVDNSDNDTTIDLVPVNLATADPAPQDLHVSVSLDSSLVNNYNAANDAGYVVPDASMYTIVNPEVTIPKGKHTGYLQIKFKISDFLGGPWALGFRIASIKEPGYTISGNFNTGIANIGVKNQYDGVYDASIDLIHPSASGHYGGETEFTTVNANTIECNLGVALIFGSNMNVTVNADNSLTLTSDGLTLVQDPGKNYYDPATRTFYFSYGYSGGTRHIAGTAVYSHSR